MNILWQNEHYPDPIKGGGGAINTYYIVTALRRLGHQAVILARGPSERLPFVEQVNGTTVQRVAPPALPEKLWPLWPLLETRYLVPALEEVIRDFALFIGIDYSFALGVKRLYPDRPLIYRVEGNQRSHDKAVGAMGNGSGATALPAKRRYLRRLLALENDFMERRAWKICDAMVVKSEFMKSEMHHWYGVPRGKMQVIPNGVDYARYANAKATPETFARLGNAGRKKTVILSCGRLVPMKNNLFLLRAFARMQLRGQAILAILGEGAERPGLEREAERLGVASETRFLGHSDRVEEYLASADIFVLPSVYEPFGNSLIEAMAAGLACVALRPDSKTVRTASREIIEDGVTGFLVDGNDSEPMARRLDGLVGDPGARQAVGSAAQSECRRKYDWELCARGYLSLADAVRGQGRSKETKSVA